MPDRSIQTRLRIAMAIVVMLSHLCLSTTADFGSAVLFIPTIALLIMPVTEWIDRRYPIFRHLTSVVSAVYAISLPFFFILMNLLDAVVSLVIYIQLYTLLHHKHERNYDHIVLMSFFLVLASCVLTPSPAIGVALVLFVLAVVWFFVLLEMHASSTGPSSTGPLSTGPKQKGSVHVVDLRALSATVDAEPRRLFDTRLNAWIAALSCALVVVTALSFVAMPRMEAGMFGSSSAEETMQTGLDPEVELTSGGTLLLDTSPVMRVVFPEEESQVFNEDLMFWRSSTLNFYTGTGWARRDLTSLHRGTAPSMEYLQYSSSTAWNDPEEGLYRLEFGHGRLVVQEIFLDSLPEDGGVPALSMAQAVEPMEGQKGLRFWWDNAADYTIVVRSRSDSGVHYRVWSEVSTPNPDDLRAAPTDYRSIINQRDLDVLTNQDLTQETLDLVARITADAPTGYDKIMAIERWLTSQLFTYSREIPELPAEQPIDAFIHRTRTGHCELFASAMALMVRSLGIPTRVVSGYRGGDFNWTDRSYTITADTAHLWVEIFFPTFGWVTFDPSPYDPNQEGLSLTMLQRAWARYTLQGKMLWYRNVVGFDPRLQFQLLRTQTLDLFRGGPNNSAEDEVEEGNKLEVLLLPLAAFAAIGSGSFLIWRKRRPARLRRHVLSEDQGRAIRLHGMLTGRLKHLGIPWRGKTVEELRSELARVSLQNPENAFVILESYNAARFGARSLPPDGFARLKKLVRGLRISRQS